MKISKTKCPTKPQASKILVERGEAGQPHDYQRAAEPARTCSVAISGQAQPMQ
jgi:hypothetical protein